MMVDASSIGLHVPFLRPGPRVVPSERRVSSPFTSWPSSIQSWGASTSVRSGAGSAERFIGTDSRHLLDWAPCVEFFPNLSAGHRDPLGRGVRTVGSPGLVPTPTADFPPRRARKAWKRRVRNCLRARAPSATLPSGILDCDEAPPRIPRFGRWAPSKIWDLSSCLKLVSFLITS